VANTSINHMLFVAQPSNRLAEFVPELVQIETADILEFDLLEIRPDALDRVQLWRITRPMLDLSTMGRCSLIMPQQMWVILYGASR
jgi:hypothetical protein